VIILSVVYCYYCTYTKYIIIYIYDILITYKANLTASWKATMELEVVVSLQEGGCAVSYGCKTSNVGIAHSNRIFRLSFG